MVCKRFYSVFLAIYGAVTILAAEKSITDSTFALEEVVVKGSRLNDFAVGSAVQTIDSFILFRHKTQSLAELLASETSVSLKSYGPGGLASISLRGGGTRHTAILWNGLNLQSPMNASFNFSSIPVNFIDGVCIQRGGAGTLFGSGATTGTIHINNLLKFNQPSSIEIGGSAGSFETYNQVVKGVYSSKSYATAVRFSHMEGANNFTFINNEKFNHPLDTLKNAAYVGNSFMQQNAVRIGANSIIRSDIWYQKYNKQVPSLMSDMEPGHNRQTDENIRFSLNSSHDLSGVQLDARLGLLYDKVLYNETNSHSLSVISEMEAKYNLANRHFFNLGINYTYETAYSSGYTNNPNRQKIAIFGSYGINYLYERAITVVNFRQENINSEFIPFVYSIASKIECLQGLFVKGNISKNYSLPTFNDLYWMKSIGAEGNPHLKPESGFSMEGGIEYKLATDFIHFNSEASVYRSEINNWIIWLESDQGIWKPRNFERGLSKGIELNSELLIRYAEFKLRFAGMYAYTYAKPIKTEETEDYNGQQMVYVPRNKETANVLFGWKTLNISYAHSYTDQRYTSPGQTLKSFQLGEASVSNDWFWRLFSINLFFKVDNIWNTSYQLTKGYAMPGRSYTCGLNFKFHTK